MSLFADDISVGVVHNLSSSVRTNSKCCRQFYYECIQRLFAITGYKYYF